MRTPRAPQSRSNLILTNLALVIIGCASLALYRVGLRAKSPTVDIVWFIQLALTQSALYLIAVWLVVRARPARTMLIMTMIFAALFRLSVLFAPPYLSDDIYRYVWDGRVQAAGINPYRYIPADPALQHLRDDSIYPKINRKDYAVTIYPPLAEFIYLITTRISESVTWMKATMVLFEAIACGALISVLISLGMAPQRILIYAWHPLAVWEFAGNGHVDAATIALIALALLARQRNRDAPAGIALAGAALVKFFPAVVLPAFFARRRWLALLSFAGAFALAYVPYLSVGPKNVLGWLLGYTRERGIVSGEQFYLLSVARRLLHAPNLPNTLFLIFAALILLSLASWAIRKPKRSDSHTILPSSNWSGATSEMQTIITRALVLATVFTILLAPHFPWYLAWLLPFLCLLPNAPLLYLTVASFILYGFSLRDMPEQAYRLNTYLYGGCATVAAVSVWIRRHQWETR